MSKLKTTLAALALIALMPACDRDEDCAEDRDGCSVEGPRGNDRDPPGKPDLPAPCVEACTVLLDACGQARIDGRLSAQVEGCSERCPLDFSAAEIECLAALECGDSTAACLP